MSIIIAIGCSGGYKLKKFAKKFYNLVKLCKNYVKKEEFLFDSDIDSILMNEKS